MAKKDYGIGMDKSEVARLAGVMKGLQEEMNTDRHLNAVTRAAYTILATDFNEATHTAAKANVLGFHHVYEWEKVGWPGMQLYALTLGGRGGNRRISWNWRASKTTVPTLTDVEGNERFRTTDKFDPTKLRRIHVFVWKAPMMEYATSVEIHPKLSEKRLLVFPDADMRQGDSGAVFTPHFTESTPGGAGVAGNFTKWFAGWWGSGAANQSLEQVFERRRDSEFVKTFDRMFPDAPKTRMRTKAVRFTPDAAAARDGKNIAKAMARDMEHKYIEMARQRARLLGGDDEDE